ncbi:MAG TPA: hypothetical protein VK670_00980 [Silvibacterium sp.]|nr:hypothetical protein [Silvibacterium sp.]
MKKVMLYFLPFDGGQHFWHWIFLCVAEEGQRFQDMGLAVSHLRILLCKELKQFCESVPSSTYEQINKIALGAPAGNSADLHTGNVARIGDSDICKPAVGKEYGIEVSEEADFGGSERGVESKGRLRDKRKLPEGLDGLKQRLLIETFGREEVEVERKPVAELECESSSAGKIEIVENICIPKDIER